MQYFNQEIDMNTSTKRLGLYVASAFMALAFLVPSVASATEDWDYMQHDFSASVSDKLMLSARMTSGADTDYYHGQVDFSLTDDALVGFRYADFGDFQEYRGTVAYTLYADDTFYLIPSVAYRYFEGLDDSNHARAAVRAGGQHTFGERLTVWGWHEPRFEFAGDDGGFEFSGSKSEIGVTVPVGNFDVGPFVQILADENYDDTTMIAGSRVAFKF